MMTSVMIWMLAAAAAVAQESPRCTPAGTVTRLPDLPEASGVAASRRNRGHFWAHNDSGEPVILLLDGAGAVSARIRLTGAAVEDWEDIAVAPCKDGTCVYIGDIGDNDRNRDHIRVYRAPEPSARDASTGPVETFEAVYPEGARDAESLFVSPGGEVFIITKGDPGPVELYRFPSPLTTDTRMRLERVGVPLIGSKNVDGKDRPTAADMSPDGRWVVVRTTHAVAFYRGADAIAGRWSAAFRTDVSGLKEPRGEGITFAGTAGVVLVGEGGALRGRGTFVQLACTFSP